MNYFLKKKKWMAWVIMLTFLFTSIMPSNLMAGNSMAEAAPGDESPYYTAPPSDATELTLSGKSTNNHFIVSKGWLAPNGDLYIEFCSDKDLSQTQDKSPTSFKAGTFSASIPTSAWFLDAKDNKVKFIVNVGDQTSALISADGLAITSTTGGNGWSLAGMNIKLAGLSIQYVDIENPSKVLDLYSMALPANGVYDVTAQQQATISYAPENTTYSYVKMADGSAGWTGTADKGQNIVIKVLYQKPLTINGTKVWVDNGNADKTRPDNIIITIQNGTASQNRVISSSSNYWIKNGDEWQWSYTDNTLLRYEVNTGNKITYTVTEDTVEGYNTTIEKLAANPATPYIEEWTVTNTKKQALVITAGSANKVYDGQPLTNDSYDYTGTLAEGDVLTAVVTGSQTAAGSGANVITDYQVIRGEGEAAIDVTTLYDISTVEGTLTVQPKPVTFTGESDTRVYTGSEQKLTNITAVVGLVEGHTYEGLSYEAKGTDIGDYIGVFIGMPTIKDGNGVDVTRNYVVNLDPGTLVITPVEEVVVTVKENSGTFTYDGTEKTVTGYEVVSISNDLYTEKDFTFNGDATVKGTAAGTYPMAVTPEDFTNTNANFKKVTFVVEDGTLVITPITTVITITANSNSKVYDGTALIDDGYTYTPNVLVAGDVLTAEVEGTITDVGTVANVVTSHKVMRGDVDVTVNYTFGESVNGTLTVTPRPVTMTSATDSKVYDGTPLTNETVTAEGFVAGEGATYEVTGSQTYVGTSDNTFTYTLNDNTNAENYTITTVVGKLTVNAIINPIVITADSASKTYDGTALTDGGYTYTPNVLVAGDVLTAVVTGSQTDAGSSANVVTSYKVMRGDVDVTENYTFGESVNGTLTVTKRPVTMTSATDSKTYDGTPLTNHDVTVEGFVDGEGATYEVTGSQTYVGTSDNEFTYTLNDNTKADNYTITKELGKLTVNAITNPIVITADSNEKVYDGDALTDNGYTYTGTLIEGDELTAVITGSQTDAGSSANVVTSYKVMRGETDVTANYTFGDSVNGTLTVAARPVTLTSATDSKTYDGTPLTNDTVTVSGDGFVNGEGAAYDVTGSQLDVGTSDNTFTYTLNEGTKAENYTITKVEGTLTVAANTNEIVITAKNDTKVYDGTALTNADYTYTDNVLVAGDVLTAVVEGSQTTVGEGTNEVTSYVVMRNGVDVTNNYTFGESVDGTLKVTPRPITITADSAEKVYDGSPLTNGNYDITSGTLADGENYTATVTGTITDPGTEANVVSDAVIENAAGDNVTSNYEITYVDGTLTVTKVTTEIIITAKNDTKVYDGTALTNADYTYTDNVLVAGDELTAVVEGSQTTVGEGTNEVTSYVVMRNGVDVTNNYTFGESVDGTLTVTPRPITITADSAEKVYDGNPLTNGNYDITSGTLADDESYTATVTGTITDPGTEANVVSDAVIENAAGDNVTSNYNITYVDGTLTVTKVTTEIIITADSNEKVYDGTALTDAGCTYTENVLVAGDVLTSVVEGSQTDAGSSANVVTSYKVMRGEVDVTANYTFGESVNGTLTVTKRPVTMTSATDSKVYDGTALTNDTVTESGEGFVNGEGAAYDVIGSQLDVGSSKNTFDYTLNEGTKAENYTITKVEGDLTVTGIETEIVITADSNEQVYNGTALTDDGYTYTPNVLVAGDVLTAEVEGTITDVGTVANVVTSHKVMRGDKDVTANYTFGKSIDGTLTITPRPVTITVADAEKVVGEKDPEFTGNVEGLVDDADLGEIIYSRTNSDELVGFYEDVLTATYEVENPNYTVTVVPADFTITQNGEMEYQVEFWYQNPETGEYDIFGGSDTRYTTAGSLVFLTEEDTVTTRSMYQFNAKASTTQGTVAVDAEHPTVLKVMFDALYNVVYNVVDENGNVKRVAAKSGHVYHYNDLVNAPGVVNDELNKFDGKWYKDTAVTNEWLFDTDTVATNIALFDLANNTINLYTKADVTPLTGNTLRIEKQTVNAPNADTDYKFNLKLLAKVDTVTTPVEGVVAEELQRLNSAKITAEGARDAAWGKVVEAERAFKSSTMMTTESALSFIMYGDEVEDINGAVINPALFSLGTTGSAYQFQSYNLFEDSFAVKAADEASVDEGIVDWMIEIIRNLANPYMRTPFQTLNPEETLMEMQTAGVNTSGSALAFGFNEASDLYLADQDYFAKESAFKAAEVELNDYLAQLGRRAMITINGEQYILDGVDENGNALYEKDADGNYILNFDFTLKTGMFKDFTVEATTNSAIQFIITETYDGGADSTTVNGVTTQSAYGFLTTGSAITFVNSFKDEGGTDPWDPWTPIDPDPTEPPEEEITDPDVPLVEPPVEEIDEPDVPLIDVPGEEVEIPEPEVPLGDAPKTGDTNNAVPFVVLMMLAVAALGVTRRKFN